MLLTSNCHQYFTVSKKIQCLSEIGLKQQGEENAIILQVKIHVIVENINTTYIVKPEKETDRKICVVHRNMLLSCFHLFDSFNRKTKTECADNKKQNLKAVSRQPQEKVRKDIKKVPQGSKVID